MELQIKHLSKTYANGVKALDDVTLTIPRGMFGLLGPNGAGKSTLMRTIAALQEADSGSVHLGDLDVMNNKMCEYAIDKSRGWKDKDSKKKGGPRANEVNWLPLQDLNLRPSD